MNANTPKSFPPRIHSGPQYNRQYFPTPYQESVHNSFDPQSLYQPITQKSSAAYDLLRVLKKRYWIIIASLISCFGIAFIYCVFAPHMFKARTILEIRGYDPVLQAAQSESLMETDTRKSSYQKTTTAKLKQLGLANESLAKNDLATDLQRYLKGRKSTIRNFLDYLYTYVESEDEFEEIAIIDSPSKTNQDTLYSFPEEFLKSYLGLIDITPISDTSLVEISVVTTSPTLSQRIANAHADVFIDHLSNERQSQLRSNLIALQEHSEQLKVNLAEAERKLGEYAKENSLVALSLSSEVYKDSRDENLVIKGMSELMSQLSLAKGARIESESRLSEYKRSAQSGRVTDDDKVIQSIRLELKQKQAEYAALASKVTPLYPPLKEIGAQISSLKKALKDEHSIKLSSLQAQYEGDLAQEQKLLQELELERTKANDVSQKLVEYNSLSREVESLRELTDSVLREQLQTQISASSTKSNIFVSDYAPLPRKASSPKKRIILIFSTILGLLLGLAIAVLVEALNNRIETTEDAEEALGLPVLGAVMSFDAFKDQIPSQNKEALPFGQKIVGLLGFDSDSASEKSTNNTPKDDSLTQVFFEDSLSDKAKKKSRKARKKAKNAQATKDPNQRHGERLVSLSSPNSAVSEALRTIRASILFSSADNPPRVILITSANKGEGKTTISCNLAVTLAQASYKTLLIDADLRNPSCAASFNKSDKQPGLVDFLTAHVGANEAFHQTDIPGLHLLLSGSSSPNPAELVGSRKMAELLNILRDQFDFILIDSAPVLPVADTLTLASIVDAAIMVVRSSKSERPAAREAVSRLKRVGANIIGTVVNDLELRFSEYSVQSYYGQSEILETKLETPSQNKKKIA